MPTIILSLIVLYLLWLSVRLNRKIFNSKHEAIVAMACLQDEVEILQRDLLNINHLLNLNSKLTNQIHAGLARHIKSKGHKS
jgi:hypothetical protein